MGAPIRGLRALNERWEHRLQGAIAESYDRLVHTAIARNVDFVVIAGDSFDTAKASYKDYLLFFEGLARLDAAGIPAYIVGGNHDPYTSWAKDLDRLPPSAQFMGVKGPSFTLFSKDGAPLCLIGARSYFNQTWSADRDIAEGITRTAAVSALEEEFPQAQDAPFCIGIIHTGLNIDTKKAPAEEQDLLSRGVDYWACGHLHKQLIRPNLQDPRIVFPGCIQGRTIRETGRRGSFLVTLEEAPPVESEAASASGMPAPAKSASATSTSAGRAKMPPGTVNRLEFIPLASTVFQEMEVDVTPSATLADLARHIQTELFRLNGQADCEDMVVRITLTGQTELYGFLVQPEVLERLRKRINDAYPSFFCDTLVNRTDPVRDPSADCGKGLFTSVVRHMADEQRARDEEMINYVQAELVKRGISVPDSLSRRIDAFGDAAELRVLDLLEKESE